MRTNSDLSRRTLLELTGGALAGAGLTGLASAEGTVEVIVGFANAAGRRAIDEAADRVEREFKFGAKHVELPAQAARKLQQNPNIRYVEENSTYHALEQTTPWGIDRVDADVLHANGQTGSGADIAIIDTGIDDDHPDLQANIGAGEAFAECSGDNCNYAWSDDDDHGTHCAGIADAVNNSEGVVGVSTEATLHAVKVLASDGSGTLSDVAAGIEYVADQGWDVASLSLGASSGDQTLQDACQYAWDNGVLLVAAAGNDGPCSECVGYPAAYDTVIAVSSTDEDDSLSSFSSTGSEVELAAPGGSIYSTVIGGYDTFSGTSMACPHVSGAAGQLMAQGYTNSEARSRLQNTAEDLGLGSNEQGHGLLDAEAAAQSGFLVSTESPTNVTETSATLNGSVGDLDGASSADVYFEYRQTGASSWNTTSVQTLSSTGSFSEDLADLSTNTEYEFRAVGEASDGDTDEGAIQTFTPSSCVDASNWASGSGSSGAEHITNVDMDGQVAESSADSAYYDFTCPDVAEVQQGGSFTISLDYNDGGFDGHFGNVYVDWAADGDWSNATETQIMENVGDDTATYTATVDVPSDAALGGTLARVRLSWNSFYGPTATGEYGEVNDFTVYVTDSSDGGESSPAVDSLSASEVETSDGDAEFDVSWQVSDADGDLDSVDLTLTDDTAGETEDTATVSVTGDVASGTSTLVAADDDGSGNDYTVDLTVSDSSGNTASDSTSVTESEPNSAPTVDSLSLSEVETDDADAEFDADWQVSDADGNLDSVDLTLTDDTAGETEDTASVSVSGDAASGSTRLVATDDDGSGNSYTVELVVTDGDGASSSDTASATEEEDDSGGDTAPTVDSYSVYNDKPQSPHVELRADWSVADADGDLATVETEFYDSAGSLVGSDSSAVGGGSASGTNGANVKKGQGDTYDIVTTVTDGNGNSETVSETLETS